MGKRTPQFKHIWVDLFKTNIYWIRCSQDDFLRRLRVDFKIDVKKDPDDAGCFMDMEVGQNNIGILWISPSSGPSLLAHECLHATFWMLKNRDVAFDKTSEEVFTYSMQFLMDKILAAK